MLLETGTLKIHARTCQLNRNGQLTKATIFCGFAIVDSLSSDVLEVYHRCGECLFLEYTFFLLLSYSTIN